MTSTSDLIQNSLTGFIERVEGVDSIVVFGRDGKTVAAYNKLGAIPLEYLNETQSLNSITSPICSQASKLDSLGPISIARLIAGQKGLLQISLNCDFVISFIVDSAKLETLENLLMENNLLQDFQTIFSPLSAILYENQTNDARERYVMQYTDGGFIKVKR